MPHVLVAVLVAFLVPAVVGNVNEPTLDSNYGYKAGPISYTDAYLSSSSQPYGELFGRASLLRVATDAKTVLSVSMFFRNFFGSLPNAVLNSTLHVGSCDDIATSVPLTCTDALSGTSSCLNGSATFATVIATLAGGSNDEQIDEVLEWPVHIPQSVAREDLSLVVTDGSATPIACTDLVDDRLLEGDTGFSLPDLSGTRLDHVYTNVTINELGHTILEMSVDNLRGGSTYPVYMHSLPCVGRPGQIPGPRFKRNFSCFKNPSGDGCESSPDSEVWMFLSSAGFIGTRGTATASIDLDFVVGTSARSLVIHDCASPSLDYATTGQCNSGDLFIYCADILHEIQEEIYGSSEAPLPIGQQTQTATQEPLTTETITPQGKENLTTTTVSSQLFSTADSAAGGDGGGSDNGIWSVDDDVSCSGVIQRSSSNGGDYEEMVLSGYSNSDGNQMCCLPESYNEATWQTIRAGSFGSGSILIAMTGAAGMLAIALGVVLVFKSAIRRFSHTGNSEIDAEYSIPTREYMSVTPSPTDDDEDE